MYHVSVAELNLLGIDILEGDRLVLARQVYRLCTRVLVGTIADVLHQALPVVGRHTLGKGQVLGDLFRNTQLIDVDVGIRSDNRAGREVYALPHEVSANTSSLCPQAGLESAQRATRALNGRVQSLDVVVHVGRDVILQEGGGLRDGIRSLALIDLVPQGIVGANDHQQLVRQIILHPLVIVHDDRGTNGQRRDCKDSADHPVGTSKLRVVSQKLHLCIRQTLEGPQDDLGLQRHRRNRRLILGYIRLSLESGSSSLDL